MIIECVYGALIICIRDAGCGTKGKRLTSEMLPKGFRTRPDNRVKEIEPYEILNLRQGRFR